MHIEHKAGDKMFVDYAGDKLVIVDRKGKERSVEVFVAILGANRLTYAEASFSQGKTGFDPMNVHLYTVVVSPRPLFLTISNPV